MEKIITFESILHGLETGRLPYDEIDAVHNSLSFELFGLHDAMFLVMDAFRGSMSAAHHMHCSVLTNWIFDVTNGSAFVMKECADWSEQYTGESEVTSRAWAIAIMKALIAERKQHE